MSKTLEINENSVFIGKVEYIRKDTIQSKPEYKGQVKIVILQRGWVFVGKMEKDGDNCLLHNASIIRTWGTTKGLGELSEGPTLSTKLDKCNGIVEFDKLTIVATIACDENAWSKHV